ncbi:MAG: hypothetical protein QM296_00995 [Bacillota bacterium]|nr:hypothetical protein [Bacillota bacterium]
MQEPIEKKPKRRLRLPLGLALLPALLALLLFGGKGLGVFDGLGFMPDIFRNVTATNTGEAGNSSTAGGKQQDVTEKAATTAAGTTVPTTTAAPTTTAVPTTTQPAPFVIRVHERTLYIGDEALSLTELGRRLDQLETGATVRLLDDHAIKSVYEAVLEQLEERSISYLEGTA